MEQIADLKRDIERLIGLSDSDAEMFWALSRKCAALAVAPTVASGAKWGPGLVALGTVTLPVIGTVSGTTATLLMMGGVWSTSYAACMSLLPELMRFRDKLKGDPAALAALRRDMPRLLMSSRTTARA